LTFNPHLNAFDFDHLSQSADGSSFTGVQVFNQANVQIFSGTIPISNLGGGGAAGAADFWGVVTTGSDLISRILVTENDNNAQFPDSNIGFDTFRFTPVPEPAGTLTALVLAGLLASGLLVRGWGLRGTLTGG
jgi:hypothetical protein